MRPLRARSGSSPSPEDFQRLTTETLQSMETNLVIASQFRLSPVAPTFKSEGFVEEQEWRAITSLEQRPVRGS